MQKRQNLLRGLHATGTEGLTEEGAPDSSGEGEAAHVVQLSKQKDARNPTKWHLYVPVFSDYLNFERGGDVERDDSLPVEDEMPFR